MNKNLYGALILLTLVVSGCSVSPQTQRSKMGNLLIVEPIPANPRTQVAIARFNHILSTVDVKSEERANLMYQRGLLYDSLGLSSLAQFDYSQVIKLQPSMAEAYNSIGIHYTQQKEFMLAYESFDSSIDLNPEYEFAFLNRGIALYYGSKPELAITDLEQFLANDPTDPYRALWLYIALVDIDPLQASERLREIRNDLNSDNWATAIVDFYLGDIDENSLLDSLIVGIENRAELNNRVCEAYFYIGKYHSRIGNSGIARNYFKLALSTNVFEYVEHRYARLELERLVPRTPESDS